MPHSRSGMATWAIRLETHQHADPTGSPTTPTEPPPLPMRNIPRLVGFQVEFSFYVVPGAIYGHPAGRSGRRAVDGLGWQSRLHCAIMQRSSPDRRPHDLGLDRLGPGVASDCAATWKHRETVETLPRGFGGGENENVKFVVDVHSGWRLFWSGAEAYGPRQRADLSGEKLWASGLH